MIRPRAKSSRRPEEVSPLHFEPVHIDPVFMEQIAATAEFNAQKIEQGRLDEELAAKALAPETVEPAAPETSAPAAPAAPVQTAPETPVRAVFTPPTITKSVPVTLHGLAPARGKPVQVCSPSVVSRTGSTASSPRD